ncbi:MAG: helix-turn-helix transcriptional regulator [Saccharopolyspora sp.]|uniref:helix-turn-helix domain-containing protein n=1 Tax=Saccharopolyspora TaxID=1835 RepID=UPI00190B247E|nr:MULTISPECIES: helix-turn-helix transcriptional regulator [unclassified Saccharopolyspora]MBK0867120.1 helix-turn-helix transcriptional regulator [Saccharopolyspora sp. HNM0986]MBQ6643336.1 helix-turn-helix transcriptional regulator [Saccharopolyspora sp.]
MGESNAIPVRTRRVASRIRQLRERSGLSAQEVSQALGLSMSKISRMESGHRGLNADDVAAMLGLYRVPTGERAEVLDLVRHGGDRNWWSVRPGDVESLASAWDTIKTFEREAISLSSYETMFVPGLLQTPDYAAALAEAMSALQPGADLDALVEQRVERQTLLLSSRQFEFLIERTVLERPVGDAEVMYHQLRRVAAVAARPNVNLQVLELGVGAHAGLDGPFSRLEFAEHADLVLCENIGSSSYVEEANIVADAAEVLRQLRKIALGPDESAEAVKHTADRWYQQHVVGGNLAAE